MRTSTTVQPGHRGAKKFLAQYGDRLVCVRYRSDDQRRKRFKTIELIQPFRGEQSTRKLLFA